MQLQASIVDAAYVCASAEGISSISRMIDCGAHHHDEQDE
jgi:hypothetical protein